MDDSSNKEWSWLSAYQKMTNGSGIDDELLDTILTAAFNDKRVDWSSPDFLKIVGLSWPNTELRQKIYQQMRYDKISNEERSNIAQLVQAYVSDEAGNQASGFVIQRLEDLLNEDLPPLNYTVDGLFHEGLWILGGKAKMGKSHFMLDVALAVAEGRPALENFPCRASPVLYLSLEDSKRRVKDRIVELRQSITDEGKENLHLVYRCEPEPEAAINHIRSSIKNQGYKLVVVDVSVKIGIGGEEKNAYKDAYEKLGALHEIAEETQSCIVLIDHLRKQSSDDIFEMIQGSVGKAGAPDGLAIFQRIMSQNDSFTDAILYTRSNETGENAHHVSFENKRYTYIGDGDTAELQETERIIVTTLKEEEDFFTISELARIGFGDTSPATGQRVRRAIHRLEKDNRIIRSGAGRTRKYGLVPGGGYNYERLNDFEDSEIDDIDPVL